MADQCGSRHRRPPPWWPSDEAWPPRSWPPRSGPGTKAWSGAGRRIVRAAVLVVFIVVFLPLAVGVVFALLIGGWTSVLIAAVSWLGLLALAGLFAATGARFWQPVRRMIKTAGRLADGDYSARVGPVDAAALRPMVESFDAMAQRLQTAEADRRQLLADLGHELRTPLTIIRGELEAMVDGVHEIDVDRLSRLLGDVEMMERLLDDLRTLSTAEAGTLEIHRESVDPHAIVAMTAERFGAEARAAGVALEVGPVVGTGVIEAELDSVRVQEIVANLVRNAIRASQPGGRVDITVGVVEPSRWTEGIELLEIAVVDDGSGVAAEDLDRVFDRFHSGPESDGTGLGLTISRNLARAHGGDLSLESTLGSGTTATLRLPRSAH